MNPLYLQHLSNQSSNEMGSRLDRNVQKLLQSFFLPIVTVPMNISKPLGFTYLPNADISKVSTRFDDFSDSIIRIIMLKNCSSVSNTELL